MSQVKLPATGSALIVEGTIDTRLRAQGRVMKETNGITCNLTTDKQGTTG